MTFHDPQLLWLLLVPVLILVAGSGRPPRAIRFPAVESMQTLGNSPRVRLSRRLPLLRVLSLLVAIVALARPQLLNSVTTVTSKGIDIALALDLSTSMLAVDRGTPERDGSRLAIAKRIAGDFVSRRQGDRVAVVAFAARAYPVAPLTLDHVWLRSAIARLEAGSVEDGTALGDGLLAAINRLRSSPAESRTVILVTDGRSNTGGLTPSAAASVAAALGIKVHTIGIGGEGEALFPVEDPLGGQVWRRISADLDEPVLRKIASVTGGEYFWADGAESLQTVFREIDRLEKRKIEEKQRQSVRELFPYLLTVVLCLMMLEQLLLSGRLGRLP
ncbi:MAG: VWA domain-containing protein [Geobacter sp.]|nr:VWA domain-containing protein [Geobacter sp.]